MNGRMDEDDYYDLVKGFLLESHGVPDSGRPDVIKKVLGNLTETAPTHAKLLEAYIRKLEARVRNG